MSALLMSQFSVHLEILHAAHNKKWKAVRKRNFLNNMKHPSLRESCSGLYIMTCQPDHLKMYYNRDTHKFGISRQLGDRIHDSSYVTMFPTGAMKFGFTAETKSFEDALRVENALKSYLSDLPVMFYPEGESREFACMELNALKCIIITLSEENCVEITPVDWPVYQRSENPRLAPSVRKVSISIKSRRKMALAIMKSKNENVSTFFMDEFLLFLTTMEDKSGSPLSENNIKSIKCRVNELVTGTGVCGNGWMKRFRENNPVLLEENLESVRKDAAEFVEHFGVDPHEVMPQKGKKDVGQRCKMARKKGVRYDTANGWTANHPIGYLIKYKKWKESASNREGQSI